MSLWYGLSGSIQNSSIPRGQWKAPGTMPSRSSSRTSRRSTNTTSSRPSRAFASSGLIDVMCDFASSTICLNPLRDAFMDASPRSDFQVFLSHRLVGREVGGRALEHDTPVAHHVHAVRDFQGDGQLLLDQEDGHATTGDLVEE